jgi:hypothetical protein
MAASIPGILLPNKMTIKARNKKKYKRYDAINAISYVDATADIGASTKW